MGIINEKFRAKQLKGDTKAKDFTKEAQAIWATADIKEKIRLFNETIVAHFDYLDKAEQFKQKALSATKGSEIDKMASNLVLTSQGLRKI